jgi:hypothetical protein
MPRPGLTIIEALRDPLLFGALPAFRDLATWSRWLVFLKAAYGLPLDADEIPIFTQHTGRPHYAPPPGGWPEVVAIVGRQSGKSRIAATLAAHAAITAAPEPDHTDIFALLVSQDQRGAVRTLFSYARAAFDLAPTLASTVRAQTQETLRLASGVVLAAYPCRPAAVRGLRARVAVADELAYFRSTENLPQDVEMLRALRPTLATTGGKLIILSSPYGQTGALWDLHRQHFGRDEATTLVWQGSAPEMNPTLPAAYLDRMQADDPEAYRSEVLGEFRAGLTTFLDPEAIAACVAPGVRERPPALARHRYHAFIDPSGGRRDRFAVAVAHREREPDRVVLDVVRTWAPPFNPSSVIAEAAALLTQYRISRVTGDRFSGEFVVEGFRQHTLTYEPSERDRSTLYLEMLPLINAERVVLLDVPELLRELRGLERRQGFAGKDRVDHRPGAHDDAANAAAGALVLAAGRGAPLPAGSALAGSILGGLYRPRQEPRPPRSPVPGALDAIRSFAQARGWDD